MLEKVVKGYDDSVREMRESKSGFFMGLGNKQSDKGQESSEEMGESSRTDSHEIRKKVFKDYIQKLFNDLTKSYPSLEQERQTNLQSVMINIDTTFS